MMVVDEASGRWFISPLRRISAARKACGRSLDVLVVALPTNRCPDLKALARHVLSLTILDVGHMLGPASHSAYRVTIHPRAIDRVNPTMTPFEHKSASLIPAGAVLLKIHASKITLSICIMVPYLHLFPVSSNLRQSVQEFSMRRLRFDTAGSDDKIERS